MVKGNMKTSTTANELKEIRALIERLFGELNARQDKFDESLLELKQSILSSKGKGVESTIISSSHGFGNSSALQGPGKTLIATGPNEKQEKGNSSKENVSMMEDDFDDWAEDPVTTEEEEEEMSMMISMDALVEYDEPYEGCCVFGYYGKRPLTVLIDAGGTSHNFISESLADKLCCDSVPIEPRDVCSTNGDYMVTSRACNNFKLTLQGTVFDLEVYLLPFSSNCDMVLGGEWVGVLEKLVISSEGAEFYFQGKKQFMPFER